MVGLLIILLLIGILGQINFVNPEIYSVSSCCEKTIDGAWCQNAPAEQCDSAYRSAPTSCESTSYCKLGCCYDSTSGNCMENTPQRVCDASEGVWDGESASCDIPQCELGCCLIGDQAAFVTQTRCKKMATLYGLEVDYRTSFGSEMECIASALSEVKGACVYEKDERDFEKACKITTKRECVNLKTEGQKTEFYEGKLCTDPTLGTSCAKTKKTTCVEGRDEVFFVDSCGNVANVYDSAKIDDANYWTDIYDVSESCGYGLSNADSATCGNCDYYLGSTCKEYKRTEDKIKPNFGENICRDLACDYGGKRYEHGETWCAEVDGISKIVKKSQSTNDVKENLPGSRYFRMLCYNGEVTSEPCADFRQEVCLQSEVNEFSVAACVVNRWQDCVQQKNAKDCLNEDRRDCEWIESGQQVQCVPRYPPGFDFWNTESQTQEACSQTNTQCIVKFEKKLFGEEECIENCECLDDSWKASQDRVCRALGDCGGKTNYVGERGFNAGSSTSVSDADKGEEEGGFLGF